MEWINFGLNLLAWFLWAAVFVFPRYAVQSSRPLTLLSTLRSETPSNLGRFFLLSLLGGLLILRGVAYWNFSEPGAVRSTVDFGILAVRFDPGQLPHMLGYSLASFILFLARFYLAILGLSLFRQQSSRSDSIERLIDQQLGRIAAWSLAWKAIVGWGLASLLWVVLGGAFLGLGVLPVDWSFWVLLIQAPLVGTSICLVVGQVILALVLLYFVHSYIYFGERPFWVFVDRTARFVLLPFRVLPLVLGRFDFTPVLAFLTYWFLYRLCELVSRAGLERFSG